MSANGGTISAEEAVQRAREIAARLSGQPGPTIVTPAAASGNAEDPNDANVAKKRKRWGVMPAAEAVVDTTAAEAAAASRAKALAAVAKAISPSALSNIIAAKPKVPPVTKRVWVDATTMLSEERPSAHYVAYGNRYFPEVMEKLNRDVSKVDYFAEKKEADKDDLVSIEFKGKGASDKPPLLGMPEEPLHVHIHGPKALVEQAEIMVEDILEEAKTAPIEEGAINARLAAEGALTTLTGGRNLIPIPSTSSYRPASVAQLIGQANIPMEQRMMDANAILVEETIGVPNGIVGFIIGRGGENIASMQAKTGCKVQIQKEHELQPGQTERVITLQAISQEAVHACREIIETMVAERIRAMGGGSGSSGNKGGDANKQQQQQPQDPVQSALANGHQLVEVDVPDADVGLVIGKGGSKCTIEFLVSLLR